jgi:hypothetical protein
LKYDGTLSLMLQRPIRVSTPLSSTKTAIQIPLRLQGPPAKASLRAVPRMPQLALPSWCGFSGLIRLAQKHPGCNPNLTLERAKVQKKWQRLLITSREEFALPGLLRPSTCTVSMYFTMPVLFVRVQDSQCAFCVNQGGTCFLSWCRLLLCE